MAQKSEKMVTQELREPDAFQRVGAEARDWLFAKQKLVSAAVVVLIVGGLGAAIANSLSNRSEEKAAKGLGEALKVLNRPIEGETARAGSTEAPFKTAKEKDEALKKALTEFRAEHAGTRAATTAALSLGKAEYRLGNHDAALAAFGEFLAQAPKKDPLRVTALEGQGYVYEAQGKHDQALAAFEQMSKEDTDESLQGMGEYHRARMLIQQGRKEEGAQVLADLKASKPTSPAGRLATERLAVLVSQGVKEPEPTAAAKAAVQADGG